MTANHPQPADTRIVRELLHRAGMDERAAARELQIDDATMHGYCTGSPVPRYIVLALMQLVDIGRTVRKESVAREK